MRVLVTGATGFVGSNVVNYLLDNEPEWEIYAIHGDKYSDDIRRLPLDKPKLHVLTHDLTNPNDPLYDFIRDPDIIFHIAAASHVDRSIDDPAPFILNNVQSTVNILEYARAVKPRLLLNFSTDESVGNSSLEVGHAEYDAHRPSNPYSASKAAQEDIAYSYWRTYNVPVITTRCMNIIGPNQADEKYLPKLIGQLKSGKAVTVHATRVSGVHYDEDTHDICDEGLVWQSGSRYWTPVETVCEALHFLSSRLPYMHTPNAIDDPEVFHIVGTFMTNADLAREVASILNTNLVIDFVDAHSQRPGHDLNYGLQDNTLKAAGFKTSVDFDSYLKWLVNKYV